MAIARRMGMSLCGCAIAALSVGTAQAVDLRSIDWFDLPDHTQAFTFGISSDGSVIGITLSDGTDQWSWRQYGDGTSEAIPVPDGYASASAYTLSADGRVAGGAVEDSDDVIYAARWGASGAPVILENLGSGLDSLLSNISADGTIGTGWAEDTNGHYNAVWWDASNAIHLLANTTQPDAENSYGQAVNGDGTVFAGNIDLNGDLRAVRWDLTGTGDLLLLQSDWGYSYASDVSADGTTIVGTAATEGLGRRAARWNSEGAITYLGGELGDNQTSGAIWSNADGTVILGSYIRQAAIWDGDGALQLVADMLTDNGVHLGNWVLRSALEMTEDGKTMLGTGFRDGPGDTSTDIWIARENGLLTVDDAMASLASLGAVSEGTGSLVSGVMGDVMLYARSLAGPGADGGAIMGYAGEIHDDLLAAPVEAPRWRLFGSVQAQADGDADALTGQTGLSYDIAPDTRIGASLGYGGNRTDLDFTGHSDLLGGFASIFASYAPKSGPQLALVATGALLQAEISRGYLNGIDPTVSEGATTGAAFGTSLRAGYGFVLDDNLTVTPFGSLDAVLARFDGYTETSGAFPAQVAAIEDVIATSRIGLEMRRDLDADTWLWASAVWSHRLDDSSAEIDARLDGLFGITGASLPVRRDWAELSGGISLGLGDNDRRITGSATLNIADGGPDGGIVRVIYSGALAP